MSRGSEVGHFMQDDVIYGLKGLRREIEINPQQALIWIAASHFVRICFTPQPGRETPNRSDHFAILGAARSFNRPRYYAESHRSF